MGEKRIHAGRMDEEVAVQIALSISGSKCASELL
jgi:hypothetical protein